MLDISFAGVEICGMGFSVSTKNMIITEKYCLTEIGYQPKLYDMNVTGVQLNFFITASFRGQEQNCVLRIRN